MIVGENTNNGGKGGFYPTQIEVSGNEYVTVVVGENTNNGGMIAFISYDK